jgi:hypothetical protein
MEAESEANLQIQHKDYQHTAAYALLAGEDSEAIRASAMTGKEINARLSERAKNYVRNQSAINSYQDSHLGARNFRTDGLNAADEDLVKKRHQQWGKQRQDKARDYVEELRARSTNKISKVDNGKADKIDQADKLESPLDNKTSQSNPSRPNSYRDSQRQSMQPAKHHFQDRSYRHYDPYQ